MTSILIKNGWIYDGLGNQPYQSDLYIQGDRISQIAEKISREADLVVDAAGMAVTPGFIDIHRHCDAKPFNSLNFGDVLLTQGITTTVVGNCGISMTPASADPDRARQMYDFDEPVLGPIKDNQIQTYHDYMKGLDKVGLPVNFASMIGTGAVKITVKGFSDTPYTEEEMTRAKSLIEEALEEGAAGVSVGIMYLPECYSTTDEFARLLEPVGRYKRVVTAHIRGEGDSMVDSVREIIEIGRKAGCAVEISHFKSCGISNWRKEIHRAIGLIEEARASGQDVTCDFYPYEGGSTALTTMVPPVYVAGNMADALKRLGTPEGVEQFREACSVSYDDWDNFAITLGWDRIIISGVVKEHNRKFLGMTVTEAAKVFGFEDAAACAAYLMHDEGGKTAIINMSMCQDDIDTVAKLPYSTVISDSIYADTDTPHPRMYGAFPKIIREYVKERGLYSMEEAVMKMTSLPAIRMKLEGRGKLAEGAFADVNVFDPDKFRDNATFSDPARMSEGLAMCIVNGQVALRDGKPLGKYYGKNLRVKNK
ncbi:D-aminoacylase [Clostridiales bacterium COT073_COT-073]|nr:D-aminoacylase [Clostridiales bacterium COT073_COT-073]